MDEQLAAGRETAGVSDRNAQVLVRIDRCVVDADLVMQVRPCGAAAEANVSDHIATIDVLARPDCVARQVTVAGADPVAMIDHDGLAISTHEVAERDHAVRGSNNLVTQVAADVNTAVEGALNIERVDALAKAASHL